MQKIVHYLPWGALFVFLALLRLPGLVAHRAMPGDFYSTIYLAPQLLFSSNWESIYNFTDTALPAVYRYSPFALFLSIPFSLMDRYIAALLWHILLSFSIVGIVWLSFSMLELKKNIANVLVVFLALILFFLKGIQIEFKFGQTNAILSFLMFASFWCYLKKRDFSSGLFIFIPVFFKIFPALFLFYYLYKKRWRTFFSFILSFFVLGIAFSFFFSFEMLIALFKHWIHALSGVSGNGAVIAAGRIQSLFAFLIYYFYGILGVPIIFCLFYILFLLCVGSIFLFTSDHRISGIPGIPAQDKLFESIQCALLFMTITLFSPSALPEYQVYAIFPFILVVVFLFLRQFPFQAGNFQIIICSSFMVLSTLLTHSKVWGLFHLENIAAKIIDMKMHAADLKFNPTASLKTYAIFSLILLLILFYVRRAYKKQDPISLKRNRVS